MKMYFRKTLSLIESELDLLQLKILHPKQFINCNSQPLKSNLYLTPKSKNLGVIGIAEIVIALYLSEEIISSDGKPVPLIQLANIFENMFNFSFGTVYDKQDAIFNRKPYNITKALDYLRTTIIREDKKRNHR